MTVDLSTLKVGDTVHLRDGSLAVVEGVRTTNIDTFPFGIAMRGVDAFYTMCGKHRGKVDSVLNIVAIFPLVVKVPMTIDLSLLKVGDNVHHRNGTVSAVTKVESAIGSHYPFCLTLNGSSDLEEVTYIQNGWYHVSRESGLDIVAIEHLRRLAERPTKPAIKLSELVFGTDSTIKEGKKSDSGKPDYSLLTRPMVESMIAALMYGENKYSRGNFKGGFTNTRLLAAAMRHIMAFNDGEDFDPESNVNHLGHAMAALAMCLDNRAEGTSVEGRYVKK